MIFRLIHFIALISFQIVLSCELRAQEFVPACIGFYNVENLFDTIDTPGVRDSEYTPDSPKKWNTERYYDKLEKLARVIGEMGADIHPDGLAVVGLAEVENRDVVEDLANTGILKERGYDVVHYDSPDKRGVDVALIYQPKYFEVLNHKSYTLTIPDMPNFYTRDQLIVSGVLDKRDTVHVLVAHWPSRRGGEKRSRHLRVAAAELGRSIIDSLLTENPLARIMYMGDLNDDPVNISVRRGLRSERRKEDAVKGRLYNPMEDLYHKGIGTLAWRDTWNLFDQIILSEALVTGEGGAFRYFGARVFNKPYLRQADGPFAGYPFRTYVGDSFRGGYSDHFPVYIILVRELDEHSP